MSEQENITEGYIEDLGIPGYPALPKHEETESIIAAVANRLRKTEELYEYHKNRADDIAFSRQEVMVKMYGLFTILQGIKDQCANSGEAQIAEHISEELERVGVSREYFDNFPRLDVIFHPNPSPNYTKIPAPKNYKAWY